jgi:hypothetical protein
MKWTRVMLQCLRSRNVSAPMSPEANTWILAANPMHVQANPPRRSTRQRMLPREYWRASANAVAINDVHEPVTYDEAINGPAAQCALAQGNH